MKKTVYFLLPLCFFVLTGCTPATTETITPVVSPLSSISGTAKYSIAEVTKHATEQDCWLVIENSVYDVTNFIPQHPGGKDILQGCGKDATLLFQSQRQHRGPEAQDLLAEFKIGEL